MCKAHAESADYAEDITLQEHRKTRKARKLFLLDISGHADLLSHAELADFADYLY